MGKLTEYERKQLDAIQRWKAEEPGVVNKAFGIAVEPLAWLVDQVVPEAAVRGALDLTSTAAKWLTDTGDIVRDADVRSIEELRTKDLGLSDNLANGVHNWAIGIAVTEGGATGICIRGQSFTFDTPGKFGSDSNCLTSRRCRGRSWMPQTRPAGRMLGGQVAC